MASSAPLTNINIQGSTPESEPRLEGSVLHYSVPSASGKTEASIDLNLCLANIDGKLTFNKPTFGKPHESILISCSCFMLEGTNLQAICLGSDGKMHYSEIDLSAHYVDGNGSLELGGKGFASTTLNLTLQPSLTVGLSFMDIIKLINPLESPESKARAAVEVAKFVIDEKLLEKDGPVVRFLEHVPLAGFVVSIGHAVNNDQARAARAAAYCANSSIVCAGMFIGGYFGGPAGMAFGAGVATPLGILAETTIVNNHIKDPVIKAEFEEATMERYVYDTLRNMGSAAAAGYLAKFVGGAVKPALEKYVAKVLADTGIVVSDIAMYNILKRAGDAFKAYASKVAVKLKGGVEETDALKDAASASVVTEYWGEKTAEKLKEKAEKLKKKA